MTASSAGVRSLIALPLCVLLAACGRNGGQPVGGSAAEQAGVVVVSHVHGLGFTADAATLRVATHNGLREYSQGQWLTPDVPVNDYMGFSPTNDGFYSSGHPGSPSEVNPLGLVMSDDGGQSLESLAFRGESDFHTMGVGYESHAVYVFAPQGNSRLGPGLSYTLDDGQTWSAAPASGLPSQLISLAVHPTETSVVAAATEQGLFVSQDSGATFALVGSPQIVSSVAFDPDDGSLIYGYRELFRHELAGSDTQPLGALPPLDGSDAVIGIAPAPAGSTSLAVATVGAGIFLSEDGGATWTRIAQTQ